jgi:hypothetical protein
MAIPLVVGLKNAGLASRRLADYSVTATEMRPRKRSQKSSRASKPRERPYDAPQQGGSFLQKRTKKLLPLEVGAATAPT